MYHDVFIIIAHHQLFQGDIPNIHSSRMNIREHEQL